MQIRIARDSGYHEMPAVLICTRASRASDDYIATVARPLAAPVPAIL